MASTTLPPDTQESNPHNPGWIRNSCLTIPLAISSNVWVNLSIERIYSDILYMPKAKSNMYQLLLSGGFFLLLKPMFSFATYM